MVLAGQHERHPACKALSGVMLVCWCSYLSAARCRLAYVPADANAISVNSVWFYFSGTSSLG